MSAPPATPPDPESAPSSALPAQTDVPEVPDLAGASSEPPAKKAKLSNGGRAGAEHPSPSDEPNETVYVRNLNEDVPLANLRTTLSNLFGLFGKVVAVQAHKSVRMRGQAFVTMATPAAAAQAVQDLHGFMLYGRTMQPSLAQHRSTAAVQREAAREAKRALAAAAAHGDAAAAAAAQQTKDEVVTGHKAWLKVHQKQQRRGNILRRKQLDAKIAAQRGDAPTIKPKVVTGFADEYLPPNKVIFLQGLPDSTTQADIQTLLVDVGRVPSGFEVNTIPRNPNIAFVEFADIATSATVKTLLDGHEFSSGDRLKATFAR